MSSPSTADAAPQSTATTNLPGQPSRASLNQILWRDLQALRPEHCRSAAFQPVDFSALDALLEQRGLDERSRAARISEIEAERAANLAALYQRIGQLGRAATPAADTTPLSALCLSGGGIRSATFNLGLIQALARAGLLGKFDYLSSVSGGGYIASWLRGWIHRVQSSDEVVAAMRPPSNEGPAAGVDPLNPEPAPIDHLRDFSNYLTPKLGLFSADTWTLVAIVLRNLLLNWLVIVPLLAALVALPQLAYLFAYGTHGSQYGPWLLGAALLIELAASASVNGHRRFAARRRYTSSRIVALCVLPVILSAAILAAAVLGLGNPWRNPAAVAVAAWLSRAFLFAWLWCLLIPLLGWLGVEVAHYASICAHAPRGSDDRRQRLLAFWHAFRWELVALLASGGIASLILYAMTRAWLPYLYDRPALYCVLAMPCLLGLYLLARVGFVALASVGESSKRSKVAAALMNDADREWWARLSGWILGLTLAWIAGASLCIFGQWLLVHGKDWLQATVAAAGGIAGAVGALLGSRDSSHTSAGTPSLAQKLGLRIAAPLFALCVIALISWGTATLGGWSIGDMAPFRIEDDLLRAPQTQAFRQYAAFAAAPLLLALLAFTLGTIVNVNRFSLHGMYRNRLVRAYLGASNSLRRPDPFTGFDPADNLRMHQLRSDESRDSRVAAAGAPHAANVVDLAAQSATAGQASPVAMRLLPIINVTLNLLRDSKLAWQQRKAESFSITPYYCGNFYQGYRDSRCYGGQGGITLGTAVTISGAAANPNMGYCSSPALAFLMALFNLRLGAWLGNTNRSGERTCQLPGPGQALWALIGELFGFTTKDFKYINLSDGGHFDNLGLYEVVLRRCRHVMVCDAGRDGSAHFADLGNAIRKIRIDFGIPIVFSKIDIIPIGAADAGLYCATAEIQYQAIDGDVENGRLVYLKPTLCGRGQQPIPYDIYSYAKTAATFPHEPTSDQWFSESQFESYRKLGEHSLEQVLAGASPRTIAELIEQAGKYLLDYEAPAPA